VPVAEGEPRPHSWSGSAAYWNAGPRGSMGLPVTGSIPGVGSSRRRASAAGDVCLLEEGGQGGRQAACHTRRPATTPRHGVSAFEVRLRAVVSRRLAARQASTASGRCRLSWPSETPSVNARSDETNGEVPSSWIRWANGFRAPRSTFDRTAEVALACHPSVPDDTPQRGRAPWRRPSPRKRAVPTRWTSRPGFPDTNSRTRRFTLALSSPALACQRNPRGWEPQAPIGGHNERCSLTTTDGLTTSSRSNGQPTSPRSAGNASKRSAPGSPTARGSRWSIGAPSGQQRAPTANGTPLAKGRPPISPPRFVTAGPGAIFAGTRPTARVLQLSPRGRARAGPVVRRGTGAGVVALGRHAARGAVDGRDE